MCNPFAVLMHGQKVFEKNRKAFRNILDLGLVAYCSSTLYKLVKNMSIGKKICKLGYSILYIINQSLLTSVKTKLKAKAFIFRLYKHGRIFCKYSFFEFSNI